MVETAKKIGGEQKLSAAAKMQLIKQQEKLKNILQDAKDQNPDQEQKNLFEHIVDVMDFIILHYPQEAIEKVEEVSYLVKKGDLDKLAQFLRTEDQKYYAKPACEARLKASKEHIARAKSMFNSGEGDDEDLGSQGGNAQEGAPVGFIPDLVSANKLVWSQANVNFGEVNMMLLQKSLCQLANQSGIANLRFWGKINGTERDYWIAEGAGDLAAEGEEQPADRSPDFEPRGQPGVNQFGYWVCNSPDECKWEALPDLNPEDIIDSRSIKLHFTGNLKRKITTNPHFTRTESFYLRAQIARIAHSTTLVPFGVYRLNEDDRTVIEENVPEDGPVPIPNTSQMGDLRSWVHFNKSILKCGRLSAILTEEEVDEEGEPITDRKKDADPQEPLLKPIVMDNKVHGGSPAWSVRSYGDQQLYLPANPEMEPLCYGVVCVKSTVWPGVHIFFNQGQWSQVYLGDGLKYEKSTYYPLIVPSLNSDPKEYGEFEEPNPVPGAEGDQPEQAEDEYGNEEY